jgi:hypothetical protein
LIKDITKPKEYYYVFAITGERVLRLDSTDEKRVMSLANSFVKGWEKDYPDYYKEQRLDKGLVIIKESCPKKAKKEAMEQWNQMK